MQRYFVSRVNNKIVFDDGDVHHLLHVMRSKVGDEIEIVVDSKLYSALISSLNPFEVELNYEIPQDSEINEHVTLFFALAKGDKIDLVIQKATELGVKRVVLVNTERCVVRFDGKVDNKIERFRKIAKEASEQCHRLIIPEIVGVYDLKNIPSNLLEDVNLVAYEKEAGNTSSLKNKIVKGKNISIFIGPEGGFSNFEIDYLKEQYGFMPVPLGKRILRTETAAIYALSVIGCILED